jgi:RNA polymerase-associated protein LEO1
LEHRQYNNEAFRSEYLDLDEEGRIHSVHHDSVVRWRKTDDGKRESNSRLVQWSDGSMQLFVGNEVFDITQQDMMNADNIHVFVKADNISMMCHGKLTDKLLFKPHTINKTRMQEKMYRSNLIHQAERIKRVTKLTESNKDRLKDDIFDERV